jgi:hypothetical protein
MTIEDVINAFSHLDRDEIRQRIELLEEEQRMLRILLRAARGTDSRRTGTRTALSPSNGQDE